MQHRNFLSIYDLFLNLIHSNIALCPCRDSADAIILPFTIVGGSKFGTIYEAVACVETKNMVAGNQTGITITIWRTAVTSVSQHHNDPTNAAPETNRTIKKNKTTAVWNRGVSAGLCIAPPPSCRRADV